MYLGSKKKGVGATPEVSLGGSSQSSTSSDGQGKGREDAFVDEVLRGEDIDALRIKDNSLNRVVCAYCYICTIYLFLNRRAIFSP